MLRYLTIGTPVHNSLKDMYGLFRFLEVPVFSTYVHFRKDFEKDPKASTFKMQVVLRSLMLRRKKDDKINGRPLIVLPEKVFPSQLALMEEYKRGICRIFSRRTGTI